MLEKSHYNNKYPNTRKKGVVDYETILELLEYNQAIPAQERDKAYVKETNSFYDWRVGDSSVADGVNIIAQKSGKGRWVKIGNSNSNGEGKFHSHIVATTPYDPLNPLTGWIAPVGAIEGNTVEVKFTDGTVGNYTFDGTVWELNFVDDTAKAQRPWVKVGNLTETSNTDVLKTDNIYHTGNVGINVIAPSQKIDIRGKIKLTDGATNNILIGSVTLGSPTGTDNVYIGNEAGLNTTTGFGNVGIGYLAGLNSGAQVATVSIGYQAGRDAVTSSSVFIGNSAGQFATSGGINIGAGSGRNNSGGNLISLGTDAGRFNTATNVISIGTSTGYTNNGVSGIFIGNLAGENNSGGNNISIGESSGRNKQGGGSICIGQSAGLDATGVSQILLGFSAGQSSSSNNIIAIGVNAGQNNTGTGDQIAIGTECMKESTGFENTAVGAFSCNKLTNGGRNTCLGHTTLRENVTGQNNTMVGWRAGLNVLSSDNTFVGESAADRTTTGTYNTFIGNQTAHDNRSGSENTALGYTALYALNTVTPATVVIGEQYQIHSVGTTDWVSMGATSNTQDLQFIATATGIGNGIPISLNPLNGNNNTAIGFRALFGNSIGTGNVALGHRAGFNNNGLSNKLYIANSDTNTPLVGGDFSTQELKIGGVQQFSIQFPTSGVGVANGSMFYGTDGALYFKGGAGTVTLIAAN